MAAAITRSNLRVAPVIPEHLSAVLQKLRDCGCTLEIEGDGITITQGRSKPLTSPPSLFQAFPRIFRHRSWP